MTFKTGDIFLCDSDRIGARVVKFLMTAPTLWQYIWRAIRKTQQSVRFYHAGMIIDDNILIEQQGKVQYGETSKILGRKVIVYRLKNAPDAVRNLLKERAVADLGQGYDGWLILGKTLTWIFYLEWFEDFFGWVGKTLEICVTRVAHWCKGICAFGVSDHSEVTTKIMDEYCQRHPEEWEVVYQNEV